MGTQAQNKANKENGKKGGRPPSQATLIAQISRQYIAEQTQKSLEPITAKAINDAILGDRHARQWLSDQGWGKAIQPLVGAGDAPLFDNEAQEQATAAIADYIADIGEQGQDED